MASYRSDEILRTLLEMHREFATAARRQKGRRYAPEPSELDDEAFAATALFVKYLAARAGDVFLIGSAELLGLQADEIENRRMERTEVDLGIAVFRPPPPPDSLTYSSEDITAALTVLEAYERKGHLRGASRLQDGWIASAAAFVKRLAVEKSDIGLIGRAEVFVLEEQRREREARQREFEADEKQERFDAEELERKWNAYEWVGDSMLGERVRPKVGNADVKRLLGIAGLIQKVEKKWVFTETGVKYSNPERARIGEPLFWPAWSKSVLDVLQATLDKYIQERDTAGGATDPLG